MADRFHEEDGLGFDFDASHPARSIWVAGLAIEQTFYRWRTKLGGMDVSEAKRLKDFERENSELKKIVADLTLDSSHRYRALFRAVRVRTSRDSRFDWAGFFDNRQADGC